MEILKWLTIPAVSAAFYNDVLSLLSLAGCSLMFLAAVCGAPMKWLGEIGEWGTAPLTFGTLFQVSLIVLALDAEKIGLLLPMPPMLVSGLFAVSWMLFLARWWILKYPRKLPNEGG